MLTQEEYGFDETGPLMAKRDLRVINNLVESIQRESAKSHELMKELQTFNKAYRGNQEVINSLLIINACAIDARTELASDLKLFGGGVVDAE